MKFHAGSHLLSNTSFVKGSIEEKGRKQSVFCTIILQFMYSCKIGESSDNFLFFGKHTSLKAVLIKHQYIYFGVNM